MPLPKTLTYTNHLGETVDFDCMPIKSDTGELSDWEWEYETLNQSVAGFYRSPSVKPLTFIIAAGTEREGLMTRNRVYEVSERDVIANVPGRLEYNGWYVEGFFVASKKSAHYFSGNAAQYELSFLRLNTWWTRDSINTFTFSETLAHEELDYPMDFEFDYGWTIDSHEVDGGTFPSDALIRVYGPASSPSVTIGGNSYGVETTVGVGEMLEIDTYSKTVKVVGVYGGERNVFPDRKGTYREGSGSFIFEKVKPGKQSVAWSGDFDFDVVVYEHRSEPRWI